MKWIDIMHCVPCSIRAITQPSEVDCGHHVRK